MTNPWLGISRPSSRSLTLALQRPPTLLHVQRLSIITRQAYQDLTCVGGFKDAASGTITDCRTARWGCNLYSGSCRKTTIASREIPKIKYIPCNLQADTFLLHSSSISEDCGVLMDGARRMEVGSASLGNPGLCLSVASGGQEATGKREAIRCDSFKRKRVYAASVGGNVPSKTG